MVDRFLSTRVLQQGEPDGLEPVDYVRAKSTFHPKVQQPTFSFAESCRRYGISRTAGYTWWNRFLVEGFEGLHDRSHRPHHCPHAIVEPIVEHIVDLRQRYGWGSRKIRKLTAEKFGEAPARRTIDRIFERHDLITKKRRRSGKPGHPGSGVSMEMPPWRCSALYQRKNERQKVLAWVWSPNRPGNEGWYFKVLN